ncbi:TRAP transporter small permease subunit [Palleronia rufa]|uniref:TRAP transporter small permease subunit n=1 Tax=Palleronia rufa TaxID=1530186 RepID=UPI0009DFC3D1|nr:TRAP transporter small permease subunit [Palleronia rufa]
MPSLNFSLPHWLYWVGLIVFPAVAMVMSRRARRQTRRYSLPLAYMILVTGGILGLHRFYLKNVWGLLFLPVFFAILIANGQGQDARTTVSELANKVRIAERTVAREEPRIEEARADLEALRASVAEAEQGSVAARLAERRLERAQRTIDGGEERLAEARAVTEAQAEALSAARGDRLFWADVSKVAFWLLLAGVALDALLLPILVRRANAALTDDPVSEAERRLRDAEAAESRKADHEYAENWIDRLSLFCGEFAAYWAVIAVFAYYYEVIARYVFNSPTNWVHESMYLMFGMQYLIAGAYAMLTETHVRVDIFYAPLSRRRKAWVDLLTSVFFFIFAGTLLVTSWTFAMDALAVPTGNALVSEWARGQIGLAEVWSGWGLNQWSDPNIRWGEISFNEWEVPLWPMKWVMVLGGLLLVLQGISKFAKDIRAIMAGDPPDRGPRGAAAEMRETA